MRVLRKGSRGRDVRRWQRFLIRRGLLKGRADGIFGPLTAAATIAFQRRNGLTADGIAGPATFGRAGFLPPAKPPAPVTTAAATPTTTMETTSGVVTTTTTTTSQPAGPRVTVTAPLLCRVMPNIPPARSVEYAPFLQQAMEEFAIDQPPRAAAFLAQLAHESGQLRFMEEIWGPTRAQRCYEPASRLAARLGNVEAGDGVRFKGRGPIQLTGRANYRVFGDALGIDLVADPSLAASKEVAFRIAGLYWRKRGLNALADRQDFRRITKLVNGGFNGLVDRMQFWERAKRIFDVRSLSAAAARRMRRLVPPDEAPDLRFHRGLDEGREPTPTAVERSTAALRARGAGAPVRRAPAKKARRAAAGKKAPPRKGKTGPTLRAAKRSSGKKAATRKTKRPTSMLKNAAGRTRAVVRARAVARKKAASRAKKLASTRKPRRR